LVIGDRSVSRGIGDVFKRQAAGFDLNDTGDIESFYTILRGELGRTVAAVDGATENQLLEAITNAP
jgi:hypothetical protein